MSDPSPPPVAPVPWVIKRDGRQVAFEADKISRSLFAAGEELAAADAFLCRELTDGILHFMGEEFVGQTPTTGAIADLVAKVVRELGHPALAQQYLSGKTAPTGRPRERSSTWGLEQVEWLTRKIGERLVANSSNPGEELEDYLTAHFRLSQVYAPDLLTLHADGLINLGGPRSSRLLAATVLPFQADPVDLIDEMARYRQATGDVLILDLPERRLWSAGSREPVQLAQWCRALRLGLGDQGCRAIVNLNRREDTGVPSLLGPLFSPSSTALSNDESRGNSLALLDEVMKLSPGRVRVDWHLTEVDFAEENQEYLGSLVQRAALGQPVCFVFDRPRRQPRLAEGIQANQNAVLLTVGLHLPQLARQMGSPQVPERFLAKLVSLIRLALSAATQKRTYLRRLRDTNSILAHGFFLEKARVVVVPIGLDAVVTDLMGESCCSRTAAPLALACQILEKIRTALHEDGRALLLDAVLDSPLVDDQFELGARDSDTTMNLEHLAGVTVWDDEAPLIRQIGVSGSLHEAARGGTALVRMTAAAPPARDDLVQAVQHAWHKTNLLALRFVGGRR